MNSKARFFTCPSRWYCVQAGRVECHLCNCYINGNKKRFDILGKVKSAVERLGGNDSRLISRRWPIPKSGR